MKLTLEDFSWKGHHFNQLVFNWENVESVDDFGYKIIDVLEDEFDTAIEVENEEVP